MQAFAAYGGTPPANAAERDALSVSAALGLAKRALEGVSVRIVGEVSEVKPWTKAVYFTVKDDSSSLPCMMWNNRYRQAGFELAVGQRLVLTGRFSLYAAKGRMSFDVSAMELSGEGDLRMKVANLAKKLEAEGLTSPERKMRLPAFPEKVGLVTSPRGAAVHDVLRTLRRRFPMASVCLAGVPVEGAQAAEGIIQGMRAVYAQRPDVILIVRGGGSFDDMMPFNDERLARAIDACRHNSIHRIPVVTGIGHEVDTTIADMVSDLRASTPTAAAEAVSPSPESLASLFLGGRAALDGGMRRAVERGRNGLERLAERPVFRDPRLLFAEEAQTIDYMSERLARALPAQFGRWDMQVDSAGARMLRAGSSLTERFAGQMMQKASRLDDLSLVKTLERGYSMTRNGRGEIVRHVAQAEVGSRIEVTVSDGVLGCTVDSATAADGV